MQVSEGIAALPERHLYSSFMNATLVRGVRAAGAFSIAAFFGLLPIALGATPAAAAALPPRRIVTD